MPVPEGKLLREDTRARSPRAARARTTSSCATTRSRAAPVWASPPMKTSSRCQPSLNSTVVSVSRPARVIDSEALEGSRSFSSRLPQYLIKAILALAMAVAPVAGIGGLSLRGSVPRGIGSGHSITPHAGQSRLPKLFWELFPKTGCQGRSEASALTPCFRLYIYAHAARRDCPAPHGNRLLSRMLYRAHAVAVLRTRRRLIHPWRSPHGRAGQSGATVLVISSMRVRPHTQNGWVQVVTA